MRGWLLLSVACAVGYVACGSRPGSQGTPGHGGQGGSTTSTVSGGAGGGLGGGGTSAGGGGTSAGGGGTSAGGGGAGGSGAQSQSCNAGLQCADISCCEATVLPGGSFPMGRSSGGTDAYAGGSNDEQPEHDVTVASFGLETLEVTVGRFRTFVAAFDGTPPAPGAGAHPLIPGSGWRAEWNDSLPASKDELIQNLHCTGASDTWTDDAASNETMAINCVSWFEAFAFCEWDGGRLPTEAEWEYAAAGGSQNLLYPWGIDAPSVSEPRANYLDSDGSPFVAVGSHLPGDGAWGQRDLAGGMLEWALDWYNAAWYVGGGSVCTNCANLNDGGGRVLRGGSWSNGVDSLRAAARLSVDPSSRDINVGFRCARSP